MKPMYVFLLSMILMNTSRADTIISFKEFRFMQPGQDFTHKSVVGCYDMNGNGTMCVVTFSGATCGIKALVPQQAGGVHIRDQHADLLDGELTEQSGVVYMCSSHTPPQIQQFQQQPSGEN